MPTLVVENVPHEVFERLRRCAAEERRSVPEETLHLLKRALQDDRSQTPRLPDLIAAPEIVAPLDLPRSSSPEPVTAVAGGPRLPDPLPDEPSGDRS